MQYHNRIYLFLNNDKTGNKFTLRALGIDGSKFSDERKLCKQYDDLNYWLMHIGKSQKNQLRYKP